MADNVDITITKANSMQLITRLSIFNLVYIIYLYV